MLSKRELVSIIKSHRANALGANDGDLSTERALALDHYHGRPYGDEQEGRSQVVSKDLSETVDWAMPAIIRTFLQSGNLAEFVAVGPEDEELAEQESDYTNHVILNDNPGFLVLHDAIKDALLLKDGYFKHYWDETETVKEESYEGLTEDELLKLMYDLDDAEVEIKEQEIREETIGMDEMGQPQYLTLYDIKLQIKRKHGRVRVEAAPPEEIRVSKKCRGSVQESPFTEHVTKKTRSDLIEMGMDKSFVEDLPAFNADDTDQEDIARDSVSEESNETETSLDRSMDEIEFCEAYLKVDYDQDGIAELRKIVTVADRIPPGSEWNEVIDCVPITSIQPKRIPHRHVGESLDDDLADLQRIKTTLLRQLLDNIYHTNNSGYVVNERVHLPDFLKSTPGGIKRVTDDQPVDGSYQPLMTTPILDKILPAVDYIDSVKANRTGISKESTQMDPDVLKQATKGAFLEGLNRASQKVEMITRMLAETGIKELVLRVHELLLKHQDKPRMIRMRGEFVEINPREWKERTDLKVRVGLGSGSGEEQREKLMLLASLQDKLIPFGMVGPEQAYSMFEDISETLGVSNPHQYILDPKSPEYKQAMAQKQQGQPNPLAEAEQIKGQFKLQAQQMDIQYKSQIDQLRMQMENQQSQLEQRHKAEMELLKQSIQSQENAADRRSKEAIAVMTQEIKALIEGYKVDMGQKGVGAGLDG